jgi:hypothetical protein
MIQRMNEIYTRIAAPISMLLLGCYEMFKNKEDSLGRQLFKAALLLIACLATIHLAIEDLKGNEKQEGNLEKALSTIESVEAAMQIYNASRGDESSLKALQITQLALNELATQQPADDFKNIIPTILPSLREQKLAEDKTAKELSMEYETKYFKTINYIEKTFTKFLGTTKDHCSITKEYTRRVSNTVLNTGSSREVVALYEYSNGVNIYLFKWPALFEYGKMRYHCRLQVTFNKIKASELNLMKFRLRETDALIIFQDKDFKTIENYVTSEDDPLKDEKFKETIERGMNQIAQFVLRECSASKN